MFRSSLFHTCLLFIVDSNQFVGRVSARFIVNMKLLAIIEWSVKSAQISFLTNVIYLMKKCCLIYLFLISYFMSDDTVNLISY